MDFETLKIDLSLFDGEGGAAAATSGAAPAASPSGQAEQGEGTAPVPPTRGSKKSGDLQNVIYGKQPGSQQEGSVAGSAKETEVSTTSDSLEERKAKFRELIGGEFKDLYTQETQNLINRRFRETKGMEEQITAQRPIMDALFEKYHITDHDPKKLSDAIDNDIGYWADAADDAGMSVDQYRQFVRMKSENERLRGIEQQSTVREQARQQLQSWYAEGEQLKATYPNFDLEAESENPQFIAMLRNGISVEHAYKVMHMDDIVTGAATNAAKQAEKTVVEGIRSKGARALENGASSSQNSGFVYKTDVHHLTKKDRAEIANRVARGEYVEF